MNVVFFGSSKFVIPIIEGLQKSFDLKLVLTTEKNPIDAVPAYCIKNKIPYQSVKQFNNLPANALHRQVQAGLTISAISGANAPVAVLADFGLIIPKDILNIFPKGIINIHPSLLPKYRGPTPVQTAILNGEKITGVSIIKLDEEVDHGPILAQEKEEILDTDTAESLYKRLFEKGGNLLLKVLPDYLNGNLNPTAQNHQEATFTTHLTRQSGFVDLKSLEIRNLKLEIARKIRAYFPWPGVWTRLNLKTNDQKPKIIKFLPGNLIQVEGKKPMSYKDFKNGYPNLKPIHDLLNHL